MREPCVLLLSPGIIRAEDRDFGLPHLVSMGGYLRQRLGVRVELLDLSYESGDHHHLERCLQELQPFLLFGLSCYSSFDYMRVMTLARFLKRLYPAVPLVGGGYHASAVPEDLVFAGSPFDAVVVGEGERALATLVERLLGGSALEPGQYRGEPIEDLDQLPPYQWDLLSRYWPRAHAIGSKLQLYFARGCPHHCTFCMERAKGEDRWRALSPERVVDELRRLASFTDLGRWVINVADPLFGFKRAWRRQVLQGILDAGIRPFHFWTLTRAEDLQQEDVELLARANFAIGVGLEAGAPDMLRLMRKTAQPERYLEGIERLARLSLEHNLSWAVNIVVGHPGETPETMAQTHAFVAALFTAGPETRGWLSVDPFRLYPGSQVHEERAAYEAEHGARFFHPGWWRSWYDTAFCAEHLDPSRSLGYAGRVDEMYTRYGALIPEIAARFRGQGNALDQIFARALDEQRLLLSEGMRRLLLERAAAAARQGSTAGARQGAGEGVALSFPLGLQVRDPLAARREEAVRLLLERGLLWTERVVEALLRVAPERYLGEAEARALLSDRAAPERAADVAAPYLGIAAYAIALEALNPGPGERAADLMALRGYAAALLAELVGPTGTVLALCPDGHDAAARLADQLLALPQVEVLPTAVPWLDGTLDAVWLGAALPRVPASLLAHLSPERGRLVTFVGPRYRAQDLVLLRREGEALREHQLGRAQVPVARGLGGWVRGV